MVARSVRQLCAAMLAALCFGIGTGAAERPPVELDRIAPGDSITVPAEAGTDTDVLGLGFDRNLRDRDAAGQTHRVFPAEHRITSEDRFEVEAEVIENQTQLGANARLLFARVGAQRSEGHRYVVVRVARIRKVATLREDGPPLEGADFVAHRILYGWAIYHVIEGDVSTFSRGLALEFRTVGLGFGDLVRKYGLRVRKSYIGLKLGTELDTDAVYNDRELIEQKFRPDSEPKPIAVQYRALQPVAIPRLAWADNRLHPGTYRLQTVKVRLQSTKASGDPWDFGGGAPRSLRSGVLQ